LLDQLASADLKERTDAFAQLAQHRKETVNQLLELAEREMERERRAAENGAPLVLGRTTCHLAIDLLAKIGARAAAPFCARNIAYSDHALFSNARGFLDTYPCAQLLQSLGTGADRYILQHLRQTASDEITDEQLRVYAIVMVGTARFPLSNYGIEALRMMRHVTHETQYWKAKRNYERLLRAMEQWLERSHPNGLPPDAARDGDEVNS
jgi:hypothetical protein